jgi:acetyltransferase-like isoleucine patch superfamily enzyme
MNPRLIYLGSISPLYLAQLRMGGVHIGRGVRILGRPIVTMERGSTIEVGPYVVITSSPEATALGTSRPCILRTLASDAHIEIGESCGMSGTAIVAAGEIRIGARVLMGSETIIADTDFHPIDRFPRRHLPREGYSPHHRVVIEDDVFIGARATILKGVRIGRGSVIGAGSIVCRDIPSGSIAAGNPARVVRRLKEERCVLSGATLDPLDAKE